MKGRQTPSQDEFYWIGQINKASAVINTDQGLLDPTLAQHIARGLQHVLKAGDEPGAKRPSLVITFEPLLIQAIGIQATSLHVGRSSQDMLTTARTAIIRHATLDLATQLRRTTETMLHLATTHATTVVPNYTNGVAAQPNSYGHYLLGHIAGLNRDMDRLREFFARLDRCPMGTTVLNGTRWPLNRDRMASYLGFTTTADNAYDAVQISAAELPVELGSLCTSIAIHAGAFIQDIMAQYGQPRPWIMLQEGGENTYVSSAMPQKRNPGLLNRTRVDASNVVTLGVGRAIMAHNIPPGMGDSKSASDNVAVLDGAKGVLAKWKTILEALVISPERALEELNLDWTASQEIADVLMCNYKVPFRVGHHFASEVVGYAKAHDICPTDFPYAEARRIYAETVVEMGITGHELPMSEEEFRSTLDPVAIVNNRATAGGPQPGEMKRMLEVSSGKLEEHKLWVRTQRERAESAKARLESDFQVLLTS